jgi:ABC-2 type transport system permease protein
VPGHKLASPLFTLMRLNALHAWRRFRAIREQSRLLSTVTFLFLTGYMALAFWLFLRGLGFLRNFPGLGVLLAERLLFLLFAFLFVLLLFSNLVISYTNFFRNRETAFLLSLPIEAQTIFRWKFLESCLLASWAFIFLIAPLLVAFGLNQHLPWHFYLITVALIALFIVLPAVAGAWLAVNLARYLDRRAFQIVALVCACLFLAGAVSWLGREAVAEDVMEIRVLAIMDRLLERTNFAQFPFLPSYWLTQSVLQWSEGALQSAFFFMAVLLSHVLFFGSLLFTRMGQRFYDAFSTVHSRQSAFGQWKWFQMRSGQRRIFNYSRGLFEKCVERLMGPTPDIRALVVKDARMFWRDTAQWGQTLVLFGLLGVYIINLRHFSQQLTNAFWVHLVSYLNLGACALNLATLTTRFVYPQFSLEGKRLWIVGMAPLGLPNIVRTKFWIAGLAALCITVTLVVLSCLMLKMPWYRTLYFATTIAVMTFTLTALAIGLGVLFPNFKEDNPSKIVSGFGGTFCLVLSFLYIFASTMLLAVGSPWGWKGGQSPVWLMTCWTGFTLFSMLVGYLPLNLALRRVEKFEF